MKNNNIFDISYNRNILKIVAAGNLAKKLIFY